MILGVINGNINMKVSKETMKALNGSIKKWRDIVSGKGTDEGGDNCPLCQMFPFCEGCPVMDKTGEEGCEKTPYCAWIDAADFYYQQNCCYKALVTKDQPVRKAAAQAMLDFLKDLKKECKVQ